MKKAATTTPASIRRGRRPITNRAKVLSERLTIMLTPADMDIIKQRALDAKVSKSAVVLRDIRNANKRQSRKTTEI